MAWDREVVVGGQKRWIAAWAMWLAALAAAACSDRHLPSTQAPQGDQEDDDGRAAQGDGGALDAAGDPPWLIDGRDARLTCPLTSQIEEALSVSCPTVVSGEPCEESDAPCMHYDETSVTGSLLVCETRCHLDFGFWVVECSYECRRECPEPPLGAVVVELDGSDCMSRPLRECLAYGLTRQDQLDAELRAVLHRVASSGELVNQSVVVHFENGCATRVDLPDERSLPSIEPVVRQELGSLRLSCANALSCGTIHGPMTLP